MAAKNTPSKALVKNVPVVMQMEATECGAACLYMILAHYGRWEPLEKVRAECGVSRDGSKASNVLKAARAYGMEAHGYTFSMEGMQTIVSEGGGGISGGQRQRILIARAVCGKPKILMLDEATAALDNVTQRHVSDALEGLNCTRVVIAHRLSTIRHADRIIMLDGGKIVEDGTYDELVSKGGAFADLVARQRLGNE